MAFTPEQIAHFQEQADALAAAGIADDEAREAIDGYLQAALFVGAEGHDLTGSGLSFSAEAQAWARDVVLDFITKNHGSIVQWQARTQHEWLQVGIDLYFTQTRQGAGFWSREGAGVPGGLLTDSAHLLTEVSLVFNDSGELDFEG